jgi:hypothetical protein
MEKLKQIPIIQPALQALGFCALLFTLFYGSAGWLFSIVCIAIAAAFEYFHAPRKNKILNPYILMAASPLLLLHYSSITDFRIRVFCFILIVYIIQNAYDSSTRPAGFNLADAGGITVWLIAFIIFALASTAVTMQGVQLSGDEPHYVMITQSLVEDGDFDLKNNIDEKTYFKYLPIEIRFHGSDYDGKYYPFHMPGLSFLLIPFYWLFNLLGAGRIIPPPLYFRLAASAINAFFALGLFYLLKIKFPGKNITGFWLLFLALFPLVFHCIHLYPELPGAALMMAGYIFVFSIPKTWRNNYLLAGLFLSLVPWFHIKYLPGLAVLTLAILYRLYKEPGNRRTRQFILFFLFPLASFALLVIFSKTLYGTYNPTGIFPKENYWGVPWLLRLKVFLAYFLDQRDGLLFYSPLFFLFFFSFKKSARLEGRGLLLGIAGAYVFFHAFTTVRGAYAPAGRPLMFVSWILILFIAHFYFNTGDKTQNPGPWPRIAYKLLTGLGVFVTAWLFYYPLFVYQPVFAATQERASGLNLFMGGDFIQLWRLFPSFLTDPGSGHIANYLWLGLIAAALVLYYGNPFKKREKPLFSAPGFVIPVLFAAFALLAFLYCFYPHVHLVSQNKHTGKTISFYNNSRNFTYVPGKDNFRIKAGSRYDIFIDRKMVRKNSGRVFFKFTAPPGEQAEIIVRNGKWLEYRFPFDKENQWTLPLRLLSLKPLTVGDKSVSHLGVTTRCARKNAFFQLEIVE